MVGRSVFISHLRLLGFNHLSSSVNGNGRSLETAAASQLLFVQAMVTLRGRPLGFAGGDLGRVGSTGVSDST